MTGVERGVELHSLADVPANTLDGILSAFGPGLTVDLLLLEAA